jgi:uncharacterized phiE125 gp8 family phage protein
VLNPVRTVAPTVVPVSTELMRAQVRVDFNDDDVLLAHQIKAATDYLDGYGGILGRAIMAQTWRQDFPCFDTVMRLPLGDLISVASVKYRDADNVEQTASPSLYGSYTDARGPYVKLLSGQSWPATYDREDAVSVTWVCGYGANASAIPADISMAIMQIAAHWYENREAVGTDVTATQIPMTAESLIAAHRMNMV